MLTRRPSVAAPPSAASTTAAAPAPQRASNVVPSPGRSASDTTTNTTRADPAPIASAPAFRASIPAWGEPHNSAPCTLPARPSAATKNARLGPSANGGRLVPQKIASTASGPTLAASSAADAASQASVRVSSSGAQAPIWLRPDRPHAAPMSAVATRSAGAAAPTPRSQAPARASELLVIGCSETAGNATTEPSVGGATAPSGLARATSSAVRIVSIPAPSDLEAGGTARQTCARSPTRSPKRVLTPDVSKSGTSSGARLADLEAMSTKLCQLRTLGVHVAIDDFGTGYSSLSYLKRLDLCPELDKSLLDTVEADVAIVHAAIVGNAGRARRSCRHEPQDDTRDSPDARTCRRSRRAVVSSWSACPVVVPKPSGCSRS